VPYLQNILGVPLAVESVPGASGIIAYTRTFLSKPDGYTLMFFDSILRAGTNERLQKVEYKTLGFTPILAVSDQPLCWVVNPQVYQSLPQFLEAAKTKTMNVGMSGKGSTSHLYALLVTESLKFKARYVPFGGGAESLNSLVGKHLDAVSVSVGSSYGLVSSGTLKILFISSEKRSTVYPEFPTSKELGYAIPHVPFVNGFAGPPGLPKDVVKILEEAFSKAVDNAEYRAWAKKTKVDVTPLNGEDYKKVIEQGHNLLEKYEHLLKEM
jgi:tripartite-type tricarboxylate transporter receptor subunit TctC